MHIQFTYDDLLENPYEESRNQNETSLKRNLSVNAVFRGTNENRQLRLSVKNFYSQ